MYFCCMENEVNESFEILLAACRTANSNLAVAYKQLRDLLERLCRAQMQDESLQMTDLSARISFVSARAGLTIVEQNRLHTFRLTSNAILNRKEEPVREKLLRDAKTLAFFIRKLYEVEIPGELYHLLPRADATYLVAPPAKKRIERMRVCYQYADEQYLYVTPVDTIADEYLRIRYNVPQINEEFAQTCEILWCHAQLNLLDVAIDETGVLTPSFIIPPTMYWPASNPSTMPGHYYWETLPTFSWTNGFMQKTNRTTESVCKKPFAVTRLNWLPAPTYVTERRNDSSLTIANYTSNISAKW